MRLNVNVEADASIISNVLSLPRVGMQLTLPAEFEKVKYLGCGPHESYPDRKASSILGVHETTVSQMHIPYIQPSENGGRADVQWIEFQSKDDKDRCVKIQYSFPRDDV